MCKLRKDHHLRAQPLIFPARHQSYLQTQSAEDDCDGKRSQGPQGPVHQVHQGDGQSRRLNKVKVWFPKKTRVTTQVVIFVLNPKPCEGFKPSQGYVRKVKYNLTIPIIIRIIGQSSIARSREIEYDMKCHETNSGNSPCGHSTISRPARLTGTRIPVRLFYCPSRLHT